MSSFYKPRYGMTHVELKNLACIYYRYNLKESDFQDLDSFVKWAAESGRQQYAQLRKRDPDKPHGPENSFWFIRPPYQKVEQHDYTCKFCEGCDFCEDCHKKHWCPYEVCPYTEMDGFTKYQDYLKSSGGDSVRQLLKKKEN